MTYQPPSPSNEPVLSYVPGSPERSRIRDRLVAMRSERADVPCVIGGRDVRTGVTVEAREPHDHKRVLADVHRAGAAEIEQAITASQTAFRDWSRMAFDQRAAVMLRAADLLAGPWRDTINAATMLGQSKTVHQAEIDAACEAIDFLRYNTHFLHQILSDQPANSRGVWNRMEYRPLEGFVVAVSPFNFTSIALNLPTAPALCGNVVLWKPAQTAALSAYYLLRMLEAAGLPPGVINLVYADGRQISETALRHPQLAGLHFTGSTTVFDRIWRTVSERLGEYHAYPRLVGETGGKDFIVVHASADPQAVAANIIRGGFEYQGQKCSAASRVYVPASRWPQIRDLLCDGVASIRTGDPTDFTNFMGAVIDEASFKRLSGAIAESRSAGARILVGGGCDDTQGWFVEPTVIETQDPDFRLLRDELFGPVVTVYVYQDTAWLDTLRLVDRTSPYGLTGAVFADDRRAVAEASDALRHAAGNFYVNDKPTGAVVGQQPFGGARRSGTNDKAGSQWNLIRWLSPRSIKETFVPATDYRYPFQEPGD